MTTSCPRCFRVLDADERLYQCPGPCEVFPDEVASAFRGVQVTTFPLRSLRREPGERNWTPPPEPPRCQRCNRPTHEACPICHYPLPPDWRSGTAVCVALAGARATGKSVYVGVMIKQLEQLLQRMGSLLTFTSPEGAQIYTDVYESQLYVARAIMPSTRTAATEAAYQATPMIISLGLIGGIRRYFVIRDVAGEDLERVPTDPTYLSYFRYAHAVFFLFDPSAVPQVRELLRGSIPEQLMESGNPERVLANLLQVIDDSSPPIAMILSKFDTLQELRDVEDRTWSAVMSNHGAAFQRDPGMFEPRYDTSDGELLHEEVRSLLQLLNAQSFVNAMSNPQRGKPYVHQFFAVSALGGSADGQRLHPHGIAPFRCLDPVRWVLSRQGVL